MVLNERNNIAIAEIVVYTPSLFIGAYLSYRHGFGRSVGWLYLIIFSLIRIIGAAMNLATISDPRNISLYIGSTVLNGVGLSPLILVQLGLLGRALVSIRKNTTSFLNDQHLRLVQILVIVGLILSAVGGSQAGSNYADTGVYTPNTLAQAGLGLMTAGFALLVIATAIVGQQVNAAEPGEKRLVLAVAISLPFILVRLIYSGEGTFALNPTFNVLTGDPNIQLGMAVIMEMIVIFVVEVIGLTLKQLPKGTQVGGRGNDPQQGRFQMRNYDQPRYDESRV